MESIIVDEFGTVVSYESMPTSFQGENKNDYSQEIFDPVAFVSQLKTPLNCVQRNYYTGTFLLLTIEMNQLKMFD